MSSASTRLRAAGLLPAALFTLLALVGDRPAAAQAGFTEELEATRTEAWAMRWFAAVATPSTDPFSMLVLGVPMVLLFVVAELIARFVDRMRERRAEGTDQWDDDEASPL